MDMADMVMAMAMGTAMVTEADIMKVKKGKRNLDLFQSYSASCSSNC